MAAFKYAFGVIVNTNVGNMTRYVNLRKFAERDLEIDFLWAPISGYPPQSVDRYLRWLPNLLKVRLWIFSRMWPVIRALRRLDVVMIHQFEAEMYCVVRSRLLASPVIVSSTDEAPVFDEDKYPLYPFQLAKSRRRRAYRLRLDKWRVRHIDLFIPFSQWAGDILKARCGVPADRVVPIHVGLDLEIWTRPEQRSAPSRGRFKILFVGGEFVRKGGDLLLRVFEKSFSYAAELHLVTERALEGPRHNVFFHTGLGPNAPSLVALYGECDVLVVPTTADLMPWVYIEAMAMGCAAIGTNVGAIPEIIDEGVTGFVIEPADEEGLRGRLCQLIAAPETCAAMGRAGRAKVERDFNAAINVPKILGAMKGAADARRQRR